VIGFLSALFVLWYAQGDGWWVLLLGASLSAFLTGVFFWRVFSGRDGSISFPRAGFAGAFVGAFSHPLAWYVAILASLLTGAKGYGSIRIFGPGDGLWASLVFSAWSLLIIGWLTIPAGAMAGVALLWFYRRGSSRSG
jgi:hypothetical protein